MYKEEIHNRLGALRREMKAEEIDYYLITTADFHGSEYVCDYFKSREYLSGFTGSNGDLLVWQEGAALWTDGRYFLQAEDELEGTGIELMKMGEKDVPTINDFLKKHMLPGQSLGVDGRCIPYDRGEKLSELMTKIDDKACADLENPRNSCFVWNKDLVDAIRTDRPKLPNDKAWLLQKENTGLSRAERLAMVRAQMKEEGAGALIISALDDIAWLMLMRGGDIEYNPVTLSYAVIFDSVVWLYMDKHKLSPEATGELEADGIVFMEYDSIYDDLGDMDSYLGDGEKVWVDPDRLSYALYRSLKEGIHNQEPDRRILKKECPTVLMKACKTETEVEFEKQAHIMDGVAVTKLLYKLSKLREDESFKAGNSKVTELEVAAWLLELRQQGEGFIEESFAPIIATGEHGAIIHYEPTPESNAIIQRDTFLLMDTGGQYIKGTTDITRTFCMGTPTREMRTLYTAVLRGHLALAATIFPEGTTGVNLDAIARRPLWQVGYDFNHGTGHGVGFLLNVHEGPQNISRRVRPGGTSAAFKKGMITSDEPGVYLEGKFGIRIENMTVCEEAEIPGFLKFDHLTLVPHDRRSIDVSQMQPEEINLLNEYHKRVYERVSPYLSEAEKEWLRDETKPLNYTLF